MSNSAPPTLRGAVKRSWWVLFPCFTLLTLALSRERACADAYDLLPALTATPLSAWLLALVYLLAHLWTLSAYLSTFIESSVLVPSARVIRNVWGADTTKILLMTAVMVVEYSPLYLWRWLGTTAGCR